MGVIIQIQRESHTLVEKYADDVLERDVKFPVAAFIGRFSRHAITESL